MPLPTCFVFDPGELLLVLVSALEDTRKCKPKTHGTFITMREATFFTLILADNLTPFSMESLAMTATTTQ
jgi:hypothetical protein